MTPSWFTANLAAPSEEVFVDVDTDGGDGAPPIRAHCLLWGRNSNSSSTSSSLANKRTIVMMHGGGASNEWFRFIAPFFTHEFQVLAVSYTGHGNSSNRQDTYLLQQWAAEVLQCCDTLGVFQQLLKPYIVAHSMGCFVALTMLKEHAEAADKFAGVVLCDGAIRTVEGARRVRQRVIEDRKRDIQAQPRAEWKRNPAASVSPMARFKLRPPQPCENDYILRFLAESNATRWEEEGDEWWTWKGDCNREAKVDWTRFPDVGDEDVSRLANGKGGLRVVWMYGEESALCDASVVQHVRARLGREIGIVGVPGAAHHVWLDQPLAFVGALRGVFAGWNSNSSTSTSNSTARL